MTEIVVVIKKIYITLIIEKKKLIATLLSNSLQKTYNNIISSIKEKRSFERIDRQKRKLQHDNIDKAKPAKGQEKIDINSNKAT